MIDTHRVRRRLMPTDLDAALSLTVVGGVDDRRRELEHTIPDRLGRRQLNIAGARELVGISGSG